MNTELTLEYGKKLKNSRVIHQEMLCCHSSNAARLFKESQPLRNAYAAADKLRKDLKDFVSPNVSKEEFDLEHLENKACRPCRQRRSAMITWALTGSAGDPSHRKDPRTISTQVISAAYSKDY
jgi:hypothetical protein